MRKGFKFIPQSDVITTVRDHVSKFVPEQTTSLRQMLMEFSYLSGEKVSEIVNRGFIGDEDDDDVIGVDASALDFTEVEQAIVDRMNRQSVRRDPPVDTVANPPVDTVANPPVDSSEGSPAVPPAVPPVAPSADAKALAPLNTP